MSEQVDSPECCTPKGTIKTGTICPPNPGIGGVGILVARNGGAEWIYPPPGVTGKVIPRYDVDRDEWDFIPDPT